jgi:hypothetical protein
VDIEKGHEDAHFEGWPFQQVFFPTRFYLDDFPVGWRKNGLFSRGNGSLWIPEKVDNKKGEEREKPREGRKAQNPKDQREGGQGENENSPLLGHGDS